MKKEFNFVNTRKLCVIISLCIFVVGILFNLIFGTNMDITFSGGTRVRYSYTGEVDVNAVEALAKNVLGGEADVALENVDGTNEDYLTGDECPFDLEQDVIDIPDDDFGVWYVDVMDHPERYEHKCLHMKLIMCHSKQYPGIHCPGRFAMVCCEEDIQFLGLIARGEGLDQYKNHDWIEVTVKMGIENHEAYRGEGPVMNILSIAPCEKPLTEVVTF